MNTWTQLSILSRISQATFPFGYRPIWDGLRSFDYLRAIALVLVGFCVLFFARGAQAQELILNTVGAPTVVGSNVGKRAIWSGAGTVAGASVDIVGELITTNRDHTLSTGNGQIQIVSVGQDPHFLEFRIFEAGTYDISTDSGGVPVIADVLIQINDIDGPNNEQVYVPLCDGSVEYVRIDKSATTFRAFVEGPNPNIGSNQFVIAGDQNYSNQPVSGLEISYPNTSSFTFGRTANSGFLVRIANPTYDETQTFDLQCGDFKAPVLQNDVEEQTLGQPVVVDILVNDSVATENDNGPSNNSLEASEYARQAIDLIPPFGAINIVTDGEGHRTSFEVLGEGVWSYDDVSGQLTFTPFVGYFAAPTPINYRFETPVILPGEPAAFSAPAQVSIDVGAVGLFKSATLVDLNLNGFADPGETIAYVFTAENFGNVDLTNVTLAETQFSGAGIPPVMTFQAATALSPEGTLVVGEKAVYTATYTLVPEDMDTTISNQAEISGDTPDGNRVSDLSDSENPEDGDGSANNGPGPGNDDPTTIYVSSGPDRGDAAITYGDPTHTDTANYWIGADRGDGDSSTQHTADASGDDQDGGDDESDEDFPQLYSDLTRPVTVIVNEPTPGAGFLQVFVDFGGDGTFLSLGDQVATNIRDGGPQDLDGAVNGQITFPLAVPATAILTPTVARLRWSSVSGLDSVSAAADGEVEDYGITIRTPPDVDRGDAPATYGDPQHIIEGPGASEIYLGTIGPDADILSQSGLTADGDDLDGNDDEDGVVPPQLFRGGQTDITVVVNDATAPGQTAAFLQAFIDFDGNGNFAQAGEQVALNLQDGGPLDKDNVVNGTITFEVSVPADATLTQTFARFRWSTNNTGLATVFDGEVEDYAVTISGDPPPFSCDASFYQYVDDGDEIRRLTFSANAGSYNTTVTTIGTAPRRLQAGWGFNEQDGYFYGVRPGRRDLYRIEGDGTFVDLGNLPGGAADGSDAGDVLPNGVMVYKASDDEWQLIDLTAPLALSDAGTLTLSQQVNASDFAFNPVDGNFYGVNEDNNQLFRVSANGGVAGSVVVTQFGPNTFDNTYSSVWFDRDGNLYLYAQIGNQILRVDTTTGVSDVLTTVSANDASGSDGMSCRGPSPFPLGTIAGNIYSDDNASDIKEAGEANLGAGVGISVFSDNGTPGVTADDVFLATTDTLADGTYAVGKLLINKTYRVELDEADPELPGGVNIGTANPISGVVVAANAVTENQDFGFDPAASDLEIAKFAAATGTTNPITSVAEGDVIDWIITVTNASGGSPTGVKVIDLLPSGYAYVSDDAPASGDTYDPATGLWVLNEILTGVTKTLTITVTVLGEGELTNSAEIIASSLPDPDSDPNSGPFVDDFADQIADDDEASYSLTLNTGDRTLSGRVFLDNGDGGGIAHDAIANGAEAGSQSATLEVLDDTGAVLASPTIGADGAWSYALAADYAGAITIRVTPIGAHRTISEATAGLPGVDAGDPHDGEFTFTPELFGDVSVLDIGIIATPKLSQDRRSAIGRGQIAELPHIYVATTDGDVTFGYENENSSAPGSFSAAVYLDTNCDGSSDAAITAPVAVTAGQQMCVISRVSSGSGVGPGAQYSYDLVATTAFTGTTASSTARNIDQVIVSAGQGEVELSKTVENQTLNSPEGTSNLGQAGDVLLYRIYLSNASALPVSSINVFDKTPAYTRLAAPVPSPVSVSPNLTCSLVSPTTNVAGYAGPLEWSCSGFLNPGEVGPVSFQVEISP